MRWVDEERVVVRLPDSVIQPNMKRGDAYVAWLQKSEQLTGVSDFWITKYNGGRLGRFDNNLKLELRIELWHLRFRAAGYLLPRLCPVGLQANECQYLTGLSISKGVSWLARDRSAHHPSTPRECGPALLARILHM